MNRNDILTEISVILQFISKFENSNKSEDRQLVKELKESVQYYLEKLKEE